MPDRRLIQFDCGKLQEMAVLLRRLKAGQHRVLIFTQMARMLDVLEAFLNLHGHTYMRCAGQCMRCMSYGGQGGAVHEVHELCWYDWA